MLLAVTNHAVERYQQRVPSAAKLDRESIRTMIRMEVERAFETGGVRDHPGYPDRRMIPFTVGKEQMYLALGPNTTEYPGEWAVIGVLFDREVGQKSMGTLGDVVSDAVRQKLSETVSVPKTKYLVRIGGNGSKEIYEAADNDALKDLITRRQPKPDEVDIFERRDLTVRTEYIIEPPKK